MYYDSGILKEIYLSSLLLIDMNTNDRSSAHVKEKKVEKVKILNGRWNLIR